MPEETKQILSVCAAIGVIVMIIHLIVQVVSALSAVFAFFLPSDEHTLVPPVNFSGLHCPV